ncbi:hypothetical protein H8A99_35195, partial [Bradyrhizobium sp. Arg68]|nr:hypothetical protein [Bradyrhizobium ivorense]
NILGILGLSQIVYIAGKLVSPSGASQLNAVLTDLRAAEAEFREAAFNASGPPPSTAVMTLQGAIDRAGVAAYAKYLEKAKGAAKLFTGFAGRASIPRSSNHHLGPTSSQDSRSPNGFDSWGKWLRGGQQVGTSGLGSGAFSRTRAMALLLQ